MVPKIIESGDPFFVLLGVIFRFWAKRAQDGARMAHKGAKMAPISADVKGLMRT